MFFKNLIEDNGWLFGPAQRVAMDTTGGRHGGGSIRLSFKQRPNKYNNETLKATH